MNSAWRTRLLGLWALVCLALCACAPAVDAPLESGSRGSHGAQARSTAPAPRATGVGFKSKSHLATHFEKHGAEFEVASAAEYLKLAQALRDAPTSEDVREIVRADGVVTRFDRQSGAFIAFEADGTIRTFFKPGDGEAYFRRQAKRDSP
jgi:pyocin large subunit-like protein